MAKDAKGHGSEKRGSVMPSRPATQSDYMQRQRDEDRVAASALAAPGNPKSVAAPVHPAQAGMSALVNTVKSAYAGDPVKVAMARARYSDRGYMDASPMNGKK